MSCHQQGPARVLQAGVCSQWAGRAAITTNSKLKDFLNYEDVPFSAVLRELFSQEAVQLFLHTEIKRCQRPKCLLRKQTNPWNSVPSAMWECL